MITSERFRKMPEHRAHGKVDALDAPISPRDRTPDRRLLKGDAIKLCLTTHHLASDPLTLGALCPIAEITDRADPERPLVDLHLAEADLDREP